MELKEMISKILSSSDSKEFIELWKEICLSYTGEELQWAHRQTAKKFIEVINELREKGEYIL